MRKFIQDLKKGDKFIFNDKIYTIKQKFSDWKKNTEPYLVTTCGEVFMYGELEVVHLQEKINNPKKGGKK